jgi:hypothetical protein
VKSLHWFALSLVSSHTDCELIGFPFVCFNYTIFSGQHPCHYIYMTYSKDTIVVYKVFIRSHIRSIITLVHIRIIITLVHIRSIITLVHIRSIITLVHIRNCHHCCCDEPC